MVLVAISETISEMASKGIYFLLESDIVCLASITQYQVIDKIKKCVAQASFTCHAAHRFSLPSIALDSNFTKIYGN